MTREEAIEILKDTPFICPSVVDIDGAINMAISALEQEPCNDAISREALLKKQYRIDDSATLSIRDVVNVEDIEDEPPVTLSRCKGHWIKTNSGYECSECAIESRSKSDFCQYCGAEYER